MIDLEHLRSWVGRTSSADERIGPVPAAAMAATLDLTLPVGLGTPLPPLWHWLHFLPLARRSELGPDGHPQRGGFLPPVPLPRRMWAGGRLRFDRPLRIGDEASRRSTVVDVSHKRGRSGDRTSA
ncbi:MAG TPA: MaoC family dehydratase N-terminal domain-containing protein, partial [Burkholderiaceae bacterium]|nr:MaoC family dehydratase N-terminal domain-containing protein [Burkholderiaceae bacterium]